MKTDSIKRKLDFVISQYDNHPVIQERNRIERLTNAEVEKEFENFVLELCRENDIKTYDQFKDEINRKSFKSVEYAYPYEVRNSIDLVKDDILLIIAKNEKE